MMSEETPAVAEEKMIFNYQCPAGHVTSVNIKFGEKPDPEKGCPCGAIAKRLWEAPHISVAPDEFTVDPRFAVSRGGRAVSQEEATRREKQIARGIEQRRKELKGTRNKKGWKQTHSIPPEAYYGKVRETGDKNYWKDPKNLQRAKQFKVSD